MKKLFLSDFNKTFSQIFEKSQLPNFIKIHTVGAELFHDNGLKDGHDEVNCRVSELC